MMMQQIKLSVVQGGLSCPVSALCHALGRGSVVEPITNEDGTVGHLVIEGNGQLFAQFHPENGGYRATMPDTDIGSRSLAWAKTVDELCEILLRHHVH